MPSTPWRWCADQDRAAHDANAREPNQQVVKPRHGSRTRRTDMRTTFRLVFHLEIRVTIASVRAPSTMNRQLHVLRTALALGVLTFHFSAVPSALFLSRLSCGINETCPSGHSYETDLGPRHRGRS